ncbi:small t antigen [Betapolyomavirus hominis]|uniref:Small t antigen n=13 Tax=BK polyomavirus TaxID=1891762 RepID=Q6GWP0_POVBK|nr:small t antigen [Betapolyomavirus hominis]AAT47385.1 small t antigen [Betapolyomavirus hominis]AAT47391.1 small t antigen [Betapolyomavirus hominis]AAT47409.1 small t antigen [Betapolyomavirus hominis]AAT47421.1 small t antigen [Betapolyomavirus hominis]
MDKVLNREESMELMDLLGLERAAWGNLPLMRKAYLRKCKEFHPDKGGDEDKMKRMNTLYKKMEQDVKVAHQPDFGTWSSSEVCADFPLCPDTLYCKDWPICSKKPSVHCPCMLCQLRLRHLNRKFLRKEPLVWIDCYCIDCFTQWFGLDLTEETLQWWVQIIGETPFRDLKL